MKAQNIRGYQSSIWASRSLNYWGGTAWKSRLPIQSTTSPPPKFYTHVNKFFLKSEGGSLTSQVGDARPGEAEAGR